MNSKKFPGVIFRPVHYQPTCSKFHGELCSGVQIHIIDRHKVQPLAIGVTLMYTIQKNYEAFSFLPPIQEGSRPFIDLLGGDNVYREASVDVPRLLEQFRTESEAFAQMKQPYHLY
jgi:uncharacterized protein YbbC (DUF1343 family)